jgi:hypothetical protein
MGWKAADGSWAGDTPGQDPGLPVPPGRDPGPPGPRGSWGLPAGFGHDGAWDRAAPSAALATALEQAAGPEGLYDGADAGALVGIARQWTAVESWAAAGKLAALRAMMREDAGGRPLLRRRQDLPEGWDDSLTYEVSGALAIGPVSAGNLAALAWALGTRLAGTGRLLADGTLTLAKARLVAQLFEALDEDEAARAEALVLGQLPGKTYPQIEKLAWRAALAVAPGRRGTAQESGRAARPGHGVPGDIRCGLGVKLLRGVCCFCWGMRCSRRNAGGWRGSGGGSRGTGCKGCAGRRCGGRRRLCAGRSGRGLRVTG